jgi:hypothetical protein
MTFIPRTLFLALGIAALIGAPAPAKETNAVTMAQHCVQWYNGLDQSIWLYGSADGGGVGTLEFWNIEPAKGGKEESIRKRRLTALGADESNQGKDWHAVIEWKSKETLEACMERRTTSDGSDPLHRQFTLRLNGKGEGAGVKVSLKAPGEHGSKQPIRATATLDSGSTFLADIELDKQKTWFGEEFPTLRVVPMAETRGKGTPATAPVRPGQ